jgi:hypothetical protein
MAHDDGEARASTPSGSSSSSFELVAIASFEEGDAAAVGDRTSDAVEEEGVGGERWCASDATRRDDRVARSISPGVDASGRRRLIILKVYLRVYEYS